MEAGWFKSDHHRSDLTGELPVVVCLSLCRRDVADGFEQAVVVKPRHPFKRRQLHGFLGFPRPSAMDQLGLVEPIDGFCQSVVIAVAFAADRGLDASFSQPLGVPDADVLRASVAVAYQASVALGLPGIQGLLQRIEHEVRAHRTAHPPAHDTTGEHVDDEGHVQPALPGRYVREVDDPQLVWPLGPELPVDPVQRTRRLGIPDGGTTTLPRITPRSPILRISRSTVQRATVTPSRASYRQTLSAP
jgi:hypothetical protein